MDKKIRYHLPWLAWVLIICVLSFLPGNQLPQVTWDLISPDTLVHFILYLVLSILLVVGFHQKKANPLPARLYLWIVLAGIAFGVFVEGVQGSFIYRRYFDPGDIAANSFGTIFGVIVMARRGRKLV